MELLILLVATPVSFWLLSTPEILSQMCFVARLRQYFTQAQSLFYYRVAVVLGEDLTFMPSFIPIVPSASTTHEPAKTPHQSSFVLQTFIVAFRPNPLEQVEAIDRQRSLAVQAVSCRSSSTANPQTFLSDSVTAKPPKPESTKVNSSLGSSCFCCSFYLMGC